jgi:hypothetical protein
MTELTIIASHVVTRLEYLVILQTMRRIDTAEVQTHRRPALQDPQPFLLRGETLLRLSQPLVTEDEKPLE